MKNEEALDFWQNAPTIMPFNSFETFGKYPLLKRLDKDNGQIRFWQIGIDNAGALIRIIYGVEDTDKPTHDKRDVVSKGNKALNVQAVQEASKRYEEKLLNGYLPENHNVNGKDHLPMLALDYDPDIIKDWDKVYVSVKMDGERCLAFWEIEAGKVPLGGMKLKDFRNAMLDPNKSDSNIANPEGLLHFSNLMDNLNKNKIIMKTRGNHKIVYLDHIRYEIEVLLSFLSTDICLDGELYSFNVKDHILKSIFRTSKEPHPCEKLVGYYIFDIIDNQNMPYELRYNILLEAYQKASKYFFFTSVFLVNLFKVSSEDEIWKLHNSVKSIGQEGLVLRQMGPDSTYRGGKKRSKNVLKFKVYKDVTVKIIGVVQGATGRESECAMLKVLTPDGTELEVRPCGTFEERQSWLENPSLVVGKAATLKYFDIQDKGDINSKPYQITITEIKDYGI